MWHGDSWEGFQVSAGGLDYQYASDNPIILKQILWGLWPRHHPFVSAERAGDRNLLAKAGIQSISQFNRSFEEAGKRAAISTSNVTSTWRWSRSCIGSVRRGGRGTGSTGGWVAGPGGRAHLE